MEDKYLGKRLDGRYLIEEVIGVGGMAVVYKATEITENRTVAVKILKDEYADNEDFVRRFINEAKAISVLNHINIVKVYDASVSDTVKYMVMEYIDGITLKEYIANHGSLRWKEAVFFAVQILRALQHAHDKGIVHRDVKPQNIMLLSDGTVKVADFGIARFARSSQQTVTNKAIGSVHYISPEQARGEVTDEKADIYSVGVIMYEMLTGELPFQAESAVSVAIMQLQNAPKKPTEIDPSIPKGLEQITLHAMQKDARLRYQSAAEMLHDLEEFRRDPEMTFEFSYFVDEEPTRFVELDQKDGSEKENASKSEEEHSMVLPILSGIAAAFVIAILIIGGVFAYTIFGNKTVGHAVVDFRGHTYTQVLADYGNVFSFEAKYEYNSDYEPGIVIAQSQNEGKVIKKTQKIILTVSQGNVQTDVPATEGLTVSAAAALLTKSKLAYEIRYIETDAYTAGTVITTSPAAGETVYEGTVITVDVAKAPGAQMVNMPDVSKNKLDSAKKILETAGLTVSGNPIEVYSNGYTLDGKKINAATGLPSGYVAAQEPGVKDGAQVEKGTAVKLYVSNGKNYYAAELECPVNSAIIVGNSSVLYARCDGSVLAESSSFNPAATSKVKIALKHETDYKSKGGVKTVEVYFKDPMGTDVLYIVYEVDFDKGTATVVLDNSN